MASRSFFIELRVNFNDEHRVEKEEMLKALAAKFCNVLLAQALMLKDRSDPYVSLVYSGGEDGPVGVKLSDYQVEGECPACGHEL